MHLSAAVGWYVAAWTVALAAAAPPQAQPAALPSSTLPLQLTGLMLDAGAPGRSACLVSCTLPPERRGMFFAGDHVCDVAVIREVRPDGVVIDNVKAGRLELLTFSGARPQPGASAAAPDVPPSAAAEAIAIELPRVAVERFLANLPEVLGSALATPRYKDGADGQRVIDGFEIRQVTAGGAADKVGLRDGDVIQEVDGQPLDGMPTVMRLFGQVQTMTQVRLTVLRNGQRLTIVLHTK
jgi:hypothetical protein